MKKLNKKLRINKDTLRNLSDSQLEGVGGGATTLCGGTSSSSGCTSTMFSDCHCATDACSTNFCTNGC